MRKQSLCPLNALRKVFPQNAKKRFIIFESSRKEAIGTGPQIWIDTFAVYKHWQPRYQCAAQIFSF